MTKTIAKRAAAARTKMPEDFAWHRASAQQVLERLGVDEQSGLSAEEIALRRAQHGANNLAAARQTSAWKRLLTQFTQPLMYILVIAATVTLALGEVVDSAVIFGVVLINATVGYLQEAKAEQAIAALSRLVVTEATVRRQGRRQRVDSRELVPGDIVLLQSGDQVPADLRLLTVRNLNVDESALTGESVPAEKACEHLAQQTPLAERNNCAYAGTLVTWGQGEGVVTAIGNQTETGRIARLIDTATDLSTPLTRKIAQLSKLLLWLTLALAAITFAVGILRGNPLVDIFMAAVALAVGMIPEGLPAAVTITLAIGVSRMARRRAIIRKLSAVETLGSTTVICSDKTGTLTENQMTVQQIFAGGQYYRLSGAGYEPAGDISCEGEPTLVKQQSAIYETLKAGLLNNDSQLLRVDQKLKVEGDPTEAALLVAAKKAGLIAEDEHENHPRVDVVPFESEHQFMATLHSRGEGESRLIYKKGAVERLLESCTHTLQNDGSVKPIDREDLRKVADDMASQGLRVLAFARREVAHDQLQLHHDQVKTGLVFLGLQGMLDPPRAEAVVSVHKCQQAGIQVKMITGDHAQTARSIATQLGLRSVDGGELSAITGSQLDQLNDQELPAVAERTAVFARVAPEQKLRLVRALQGQGHIVAMTGDGVNDAPALKQADIGVAMGVGGTEVAKGAADMLLTDDNFASIEAAVEEGRSVFDNLSKFIIWTLPTNTGVALILMISVFIGTDLPALPVQLLWINMSTSVLLGLMLVFEPKEDGLMQRPPRHPDEPIVTRPVILRTALVAVMMMMGAFGAFLWELDVRGGSLEQARTTVVNVIVMVGVFYLFNCRSLRRSVLAIGLFGNPWAFAGVAGAMAAQLAFTYTPFMNNLFHSAPIDGPAWLYVVGVGLATFLVVEVEKRVRRSREAQRQ